MIFAARRAEWIRREQQAMARLSGEDAGQTQALMQSAHSDVTQHGERARMSSPVSFESVLDVVDRVDGQTSSSREPVASPYASSHDAAPVPLSPAGDAQAARPRAARVDKTKLLFDMIRRPEGATLDELASALGNLPHSVRASISVKSRELGIEVECKAG